MEQSVVGGLDANARAGVGASSRCGITTVGAIDTYGVLGRLNVFDSLRGNTPSGRTAIVERHSQHL